MSARFIPTEEDMQFKSLIKFFSNKSMYTSKVTWFHTHHILEITIPLVLYFILTMNMNSNFAIIYSSIPCIFFITVKVPNYKLHESMTFLILKSLYIKMAFNFTLTKSNYYPCHLNWILGIIGLQLLLTIPFSKPSIFYMTRPYITFKQPLRNQKWEVNWEQGLFRKAIRSSTSMIGVGFIFQAVFSYTLCITLPLPVLEIVCPILSSIAVIMTLVWMVIFDYRLYNKGDDLSNKN